jgi:multidrug resistance efflux pump
MLKLVICLCMGLIAAGPAWAQDAVRVQAARKQVTLSGYTRGRALQTLACEVAGKVLTVNYDVGQTMGQKPFLEIDPTFVDFQIEQAQWTLEKFQVARARGASRLVYLQKEFQRVDTLHQGSVAPLSKLEGAAEELDQARLAVQSTELEIKTLKTQLKELKERRHRHAVAAPAGWVIVQRRVEPGEIIAAGTLLAQVADFTQLVVPLFVSGEELAAIQRVKALEVKVEGRPTRARLNWVNPEFDERTRKLAIELALEGFSGDARGGLLTELTIDLTAQGRMLPRAAVSNRYDNPYVVLKGGRTIPVVILGEYGDDLVIAEHADLAPGTELQAAPASPSPTP